MNTTQTVVILVCMSRKYEEVIVVSNSSLAKVLDMYDPFQWGPDAYNGELDSDKEAA